MGGCGCICRFSWTHWSILMIDISFEPLEPIESKGKFHIHTHVTINVTIQVKAMRTQSKAILHSEIWKLKARFIADGLSVIISKWHRPIGLTISSVFVVLMLLNTTFDQNNSKGKNISVFAPQSYVVWCLGLLPLSRVLVARWCVILIFLESVESELANRYLVCADLISNKGILTWVLCQVR